MKLIGRWDSSAATAYNAAADTAYGDIYTLDADHYIVNMGAELDGGGSGSGAQSVRGAIYDSTGTTLLGYSEDVEVADDAEQSWVHLPFTEPLALEAGDYLLAIEFGLPTNALRYYGSSGNNGYTVADTFEDGPAATFSLATPGKSPLVLAAYVDDRDPPDEVDSYYARLGFNSAQAVVGATGPEAGTRTRAICGWHGTWLDPENAGVELRHRAAGRRSGRHGRRSDQDHLPGPLCGRLRPS